MSDDNSHCAPTLFSGGVFPVRWAFTLLTPLRNVFLSPRTLLERLDLFAGASVLEVGPGPGYFSLPVARAVAPGVLTVSDLQPEMLAMAERRARRAGVDTMIFHANDGESLYGLSDGAFDVVFMVAVLGEIRDRPAYMREFFRVLKPGGRLSVTELFGDADRLGPATVTDLALAAGFSAEAVYGARRACTLNYRKSPQDG